MLSSHRALSIHIRQYLRGLTIFATFKLCVLTTFPCEHCCDANYLICACWCIKMKNKDKNISTHCVLLRVSKVASKLGYVTCQHVKLYYAQMQLGHKSSNTNVTWVIGFQITIPNMEIEASLRYTLVTHRTLGLADTGQASGLVQKPDIQQTNQGPCKYNWTINQATLM